MNNGIKIGDIIQNNEIGRLTGIITQVNDYTLSIKWLNHPHIGFNGPPIHLSTSWIKANSILWSIIAL